MGLPPRVTTVPVGLLHSQTGGLAISETSLRDVELHAFERINAAGGILGFQIDVRSPDAQSRVDLFPRRAGRLLEEGAVALFGCWTSDSRKAVLPVVEAARRLLFYPVQYEGNESSPFVVYGGMVPNQQVLPALDWLASEAGGARRRVFLLGSDYVFPRTANFIARRHLEAAGREPAGEVYVPLGSRDFGPVVQQLVFSKADCILNTLNGDSNLAFFAALAAEKTDPEKLPVVSTSIAEDELRGLLPEQVRGHYAAHAYFQSLDSAANREWIEGFRREFGRDRVTDDPMEPAWCLVHLWRQAVERAGSFDTEAVRQAFRDGLVIDGPGGRVRLDPRTQHTDKFFRLGRIRADRQFDIVHASAEPIQPDPYPQAVFPGWRVDWTADGLTRGAEVDIDGDL
jgi:urea transport system substrate-binding protein